MGNNKLEISGYFSGSVELDFQQDEFRQEEPCRLNV